jgi:hypothetical protein
MKYQEFNTPKEIKDGQLRVWHIPQVPMEAFRVYVKTIQEGKIVLDTLAFYDLFQFEHRIKPDYANAGGLQVYENGEWCDWYDEEGNDIDDTELLKEE